jgi:phosphoserine phosphatase RsbU/P
MLNKSIAYRLSRLISIAVIVVFLAFIIANFLFNQKLLRENIENNAITLSSEVNALINRNLVTTREVSANIAEQIIYYSRNGDAEILLSQIIDKYPFLNAIHVHIDSVLLLPYNNFYLFRENGSFVFRQSINPVYKCSNQKELFEEIKKSKAEGWTQPYRCLEKGNVVVSYYTPVLIHPAKGQTNYVGQIISELSLTGLNEEINRMKIGKRGYAFLVNKKGDYITHPDESWILNQNLYTLPSKSIDERKINLDEILGKEQTGSAIVYPEILDFEKSWVYYTPTNENRWFLIFIMPHKELFKELYWLTLQMFLFSLLGIIGIYWIISFIVKKEINPLSDVTSRLTKFSNPDGEVSQNTQNEVKLVSDSLEYLKAWFEKYRIAHEQEELKSLRRKEDLTQASEIQQSLIKITFPAFPDRKEIDLYAIYKPARVVSGDLFDYFFIDEDNLLLTIGDVSGAGIPAAIFMSVAQTIIKNNAVYKRAKNIVRKSNVELCTSNRHLYFLTLFLGVLNVKTGVLNFCNAAHYYPLILKPGGKVTELKLSHGLPLGLYPDKDYKDAKVVLEPGDTIILYTDGVTEMHNSRKEQFGSEKLKESLKKMAHLTPEEIVKKVNSELEVFQDKQPQHDDICLLAIKYIP